MTLEQALKLRQGKKLVFTNGVFDILHAGHVQYLSAARDLGDMLFVGVNSDASVRSLNKGVNRPINTASDRILVLEALRAVDGAIEFGESLPNSIIEVLRPEVHVKGGDYQAESLPEATVVHAYGGEIVIMPLLEGRSTTGILERLNDK